MMHYNNQQALLKILQEEGIIAILEELSETHKDAARNGDFPTMKARIAENATGCVLQSAADTIKMYNKRE
jgi:hypothetical protein